MTYLRALQDGEFVPVFAANIFLLDCWDPNSATSPHDQATGIFREWKDFGHGGRLPWIKKIKDISKDYNQGALPQFTDADWSLLAQVRSRSDRVPAKGNVTVRTYLDEGTEEYNWSREFQGLGENEFVEPRGWEFTFDRLPQLLESSDAGYVDRYETRMLQDLRESFDEEACAQREIEPPRDEWISNYGFYHTSAKIGLILVLDQQAAQGEQGLCVLFDDRGRVVREYRCCDIDDTSSADALYCAGKGPENWWDDSTLGEDYEWNGPRGPLNMLRKLKQREV